MKILAERLVETEVDRLCDVCNESVQIDVNGYKYEECAELIAEWGYGSREDGNKYQIDLCQDCFKVALYALEKHQKNLASS
ncbi:hypothetical protein Q4602_21615 [Paraglaciecola chathamensis]|uniref:hypothetical protein n=1 Tax=Paraglaciecola chathamensis TaxID=368405 RepID=UPI00270355E0|nr:hypothetical protein [Paraglaciecola chathamensis]MDO6842084.1 hypothetical protein [Paraglaciecola chathamensis]|tara:strand:+ start:3910 stop:4152 length:243 start_codon:yes stop_codon:yes gene_type:complete